jgi:hypothetical protein
MLLSLGRADVGTRCLGKWYGSPLPHKTPRSFVVVPQASVGYEHVFHHFLLLRIYVWVHRTRTSTTTTAVHAFISVAFMNVLHPYRYTT